MAKVYIAGKITGNDKYKDHFKEAENELKEMGHAIMNPALMDAGFEQQEYLHVCEAMIDVCDMVAFIPNWIDSKGAHFEMGYAKGKEKKIIHLEQIDV